MTIRDLAERREKEWPAWIDDVLLYGPIAELEPEWQAAIGDAITRVLDYRAGRFDTCALHGAIPKDKPCSICAALAADQGSEDG